MSTARPADQLLTPLVAFVGTLAGVCVLFFGQGALSPVLVGGPGAVCNTPDCALGVGLLLLAGGFVALCASVIASAVVSLRHRNDVGRRAALRRGLFVCLWCLLAYLAESIVVWVLA
jgi:hypothetical protein